MKRQCLALVALAGLLVASVALAQERSITVASTTSTEQSGLFGYLLPQFTAKSGIRVNVVAVGTGQALDIGRRGDADVVFVHDKAAEEKFLAEGFGVKRFDVMYNDFVVIGPGSDPARIAGGEDVLEALRKIAAIKAPFISRGDRSGTHAAELRYWHDAGIDIGPVKGAWYREIGQGMGAALNMAAAANAYLLCDRGTWLSFQNRGELSILVAGDRPPAVQSIRRDAGQSGKASQREGEGRAGLRGLARLPGGPADDRRLQGRGRAAVLSRCPRSEGIVIVIGRIGAKALRQVAP